MSKILDANAILRYLLNDIEEQAECVEEAIRSGAGTIPEVVYVLTGVYQCGRKEIADTLSVFLKEIDLVDKPVVMQALVYYHTSNLDYVDCILAARAAVLKDDILTFDRK
jgi:predicted nucleic-acid-binding protein